MIKELKTIDQSANGFTANGKRYLVHNDLSVERWKVMERLQIEVGFGADFDTLYKTINEAYDLLNKSRPADASVKLHGVLSGVARVLNAREHPMLVITTLFLNRETGEDSHRAIRADRKRRIRHEARNHHRARRRARHRR